MVKPILSIVILNYNTKELLDQCLESLSKVQNELSFEVIVSDNGSSDDSIEMVRNKFPFVVLLENKKNLGFAAGNNKARDFCKGKYVLFLNSDTIMNTGTITSCVTYLNDHEEVAAMTCKVILPSGKLDLDTRRSFPTPWVAFTHFSYLDRLFPKSSVFSKYWYGYIDSSETHEIDVLQGAFCLVRKEVLDDIDWFDESYFLDGEDIDLCWKIKLRGWKIMYVPSSSIIHIKKATKKKHKQKSVISGVAAMEIFYRKRLWSRYPLFVNLLVVLGIRTIFSMRRIKILLGL